MFRIDFNDTVKSQLSKTMPHLFKSIHEVDRERYEELETWPEDMSWVVKSAPDDSLANLALRKTDLRNFMINNEGNLYNNLFFKVT